MAMVTWPESLPFVAPLVVVVLIVVVLLVVVLIVVVLIVVVACGGVKQQKKKTRQFILFYCNSSLASHFFLWPKRCVALHCVSQCVCVCVVLYGVKYKTNNAKNENSATTTRITDKSTNILLMRRVSVLVQAGRPR